MISPSREPSRARRSPRRPCHANGATEQRSPRPGTAAGAVALGPGAAGLGSRDRGRSPEPVPPQPGGARSPGAARGRRPRRHDEAAGHHEAPTRSQRLPEARRSERGELRPGQGEPVSGLAGRPHAEGRQQGHHSADVVAAAAAGDRRGLRARGLRPRARRRAEGRVDGGRDRGDDRGRPARGREARGRPRGQLRPSRDRGGHPHGGRPARQRQGTGAGPDDVRLGQHARRSAAAVPGHAGARRPALDGPARRRRLGLRLARHGQHPGRQRRRASPRASSGSPTRESAGLPSSGARCARGAGARLVRSTISRRCPRSMQGASASRGSPATARPPSSPWPSRAASRSSWWARPAKAAPSLTVATSARRWRT